VWDELLGELQQRDRGDPDRHASDGFYLHGMEWRGLCGDGLVHGHDVGRGDRYGDVWRADLRTDGKQSGNRQWDSDERAGGDYVWDELFGELRQRHRGDVDRDANDRVDLHRLERRRLLWERLLHSDHVGRHHRHRDI